MVHEPVHQEHVCAPVACVGICGVSFVLRCRWWGHGVSRQLLQLLRTFRREPLTPAGSAFQEILFYKVIDYILHGKEDIKVIP